MTGYGVSYGAVSVLNAIPCGIGAAIGINMKTEAWFDYDTENTEIITESDDLNLAQVCVKNTLSAIGADTEKKYRLRIKTEIPPSIGLKSSSSVSNAIVFSILNEFHFLMDEIEAIKIASKSSVEAKVSVTGAFDDACAAHFGGFVQTDNTEMAIVKRKPIGDYDVIIVTGEKRKSRISASNFASFKDKALQISGYSSRCPFDAMNENSEMISKVTGSDISICRTAKKHGALASGISGNGPAISIICEKGKGREVSEHLGRKTILTSTRDSEEISFNGRKISGTVDVPPSKSATIRAIFISMLSGKKCTIANPLYSKDTFSAIEAAKAFGSDVEITAERIVIQCKRLRCPEEIDVGNSGTVMRFSAAVASLLPDETTIKGDPSISKRPMEGLLKSLRDCGVQCSSDDGIRIRGPLKTDRFTVSSAESSQYLSALLLISPLLGSDVKIVNEGKTVSEPYVALTVSIMELFGAECVKYDWGYSIKPTGYAGFDYRVPSDMSSAAIVLAAGALSGSVTAKGEFLNIVPDSKIILIMKMIGCVIDNGKKEIFCSYSGRLKSAMIDVSDNPDLFPILAVMLSTAKGTSKLFGAPHLKFKESDRIANVVDNLRMMGANIERTDDGCIIKGVEKLHGCKINHKNDHRVMMALAVASLIADSPVVFDNDGIWNVSFPGFREAMMSIGMKVR